MKLSTPVFRLKRQAKLLARAENIKLSKALDRIAAAEGYRNWGHLSDAHCTKRTARTILDKLAPGDLVLLAARPGHGKTHLAMGLLSEAALHGRGAYFFTLEYHHTEARDHLTTRTANMPRSSQRITIDTSDDICAAHIITRMRAATQGSVVVIDYMQILDQKRQNPLLSSQVAALRDFARDSKVIIVMISQIDRAFEANDKPMPELSDIRLPNPLDLSVFTKACFLHQGNLCLQSLSP